MWEWKSKGHEKWREGEYYNKTRRGDEGRDAGRRRRWTSEGKQEEEEEDKE